MSPIEGNRKKVSPSEFPSQERYEREMGKKLSPDEYKKLRTMHNRSRGLEPQIAPSTQQVNTPAVNIDRRTFLKGAASVAALAGIGYGALQILKKYPALEGVVLEEGGVDQYDYDEVVTQAKAFLKERYGATLIVGDDKDHPDIVGEKVTLDKYRISIRAIVGELSRDPEYPVEFIRAIGEGRGLEFRVMHDVHLYEGNPLLGNHPKTPVGGVAPWLRDGKPAQIIIDSDEPESYQRQTVHHELNHRADEKWQSPVERHKKWTALHSSVPGYPYKPRPKGGYGSDTSYPKYFLTRHAHSSSVEDQATTAEHMLTPRLHAKLVEKILDDSDPVAQRILAAKYKTVKNEYTEWSKGKIGETFWDTILKKGLKERDLVG